MNSSANVFFCFFLKLLNIDQMGILFYRLGSQVVGFWSLTNILNISFPTTEEKTWRKRQSRHIDLLSAAHEAALKL